MKVIVIGLGSMGKRRIRLMKQYDPSLEIMGIDAREDRRMETEKLYGITTGDSMNKALEEYKPKAAFVCTSPLSHCGIIQGLIEGSREVSIFTEINLVRDGYEKFIEESRKKERILFLSSTFLYRRDIQAMINRVSEKRVNYIYHTGQYLPDWHPWENYKDFFVSDKKTNGCREIMTIEFPWINACFGKIVEVRVQKGNMSSLNLDYPDYYMLQMRHENGNQGMIMVDVVSRKARRVMEIYGENISLFWDGTPDSLKEWDIEAQSMRNIPTYKNMVQDSNYCDNIIENAYMEEIITFFNLISGKTQDVYGFVQDDEILRIIDTIEE